MSMASPTSLLTTSATSSLISTTPHDPSSPNLLRACHMQLPRRTSINSGLHTSSSSLFFGDGRDLILQKRSLTFQKRPHQRLAVNALFGLGVPELVVIAGVAALIFGPKKLPEIGKSLGKTVKSFQQAAKEFETEVKKEGDPKIEEANKPEASMTAIPDREKENSQL